MVTIKMLNANGSYSVAAEDEGVGFRVETSTMVFEIREDVREGLGGLQVTVTHFPIMIRPEGWNRVTLFAPGKNNESKG